MLREQKEILQEMFKDYGLEKLHETKNSIFLKGDEVSIECISHRVIKRVSCWTGFRVYIGVLNYEDWYNKPTEVSEIAGFTFLAHKLKLAVDQILHGTHTSIMENGECRMDNAGRIPPPAPPMNVGGDICRGESKEKGSSNKAERREP